MDTASMSLCSAHIKERCRIGFDLAFSLIIAGLNCLFVDVVFCTCDGWLARLLFGARYTIAKVCVVNSVFTKP